MAVIAIVETAVTVVDATVMTVVAVTATVTIAEIATIVEAVIAIHQRIQARPSPSALKMNLKTRSATTSATLVPSPVDAVVIADTSLIKQLSAPLVP